MITKSEPLQKVIVWTQDAALREKLHHAVASGGGAVTKELPIIDGFAASVPKTALESMSRLATESKATVKITPDRVVKMYEPPRDPMVFRPMLDIATQTLDLPKIWAQGYKGKGIGIAIIDTGVAPHADFGNRVVAFQDFINSRTDPYDDRGHGTHVAGIAAGDGTLSHGRWAGAAPQANIIGIKVMDENGKGELSTIIQGLQWAVQNKQTYNIRVVNMSLGAKPACPLKDDPLAAAAVAATQAGIFVVAAAGNRGPYPNTIDTPATSPYVLAVGATVDYRTPSLADDKVAYFSGTGPTDYDRYVKPDVVAPGSGITCPDRNGKYAADTGTSMASPLVAGTAALMIQAKPDIKPLDLKILMRQTSQKIRSYEENIQGKGVPRPLKLLNALKATDQTSAVAAATR